MKKLVLIFILMVGLCWSTDYYVDPSVGDNGNAGTSAGAGNAWKDAEHAAETISGGGHTIYLKASADYTDEDDSTGF